MFHTVGYCSQDDALWEDLTLYEHLILYAAIKKVPEEKIAGECNEYSFKLGKLF